MFVSSKTKKRLGQVGGMIILYGDLKLMVSVGLPVVSPTRSFLSATNSVNRE